MTSIPLHHTHLVIKNPPWLPTNLLTLLALSLWELNMKYRTTLTGIMILFHQFPVPSLSLEVTAQGSIFVLATFPWLRYPFSACNFFYAMQCQLGFRNVSETRTHVYCHSVHAHARRLYSVPSLSLPGLRELAKWRMISMNMVVAHLSPVNLQV